MKRIIFFFHLMMFLRLICAQYDNEEETIRTELNLILWDLQDECTLLADARKDFLLGKSDALHIKNSREIHLGDYLREQSNALSHYEYVPYELERNWTLLTKSGDYLLPNQNYTKLIRFINENVELQRTSKIQCEFNDSCSMSQQDVLDDLMESRNLSHMEYVWSEWQHTIGKYCAQFPSVLHLVDEAAQLNGVNTAAVYWEHLNEMEGAYEKSHLLWDQIAPFYKQLQQFVLDRLNLHYNTTHDQIPLLMTGAQFGEDWMNIADIILPHPQLLNDIQGELQKKTKQEFYKYADGFIKQLGLKGIGRAFWRSSKFALNDCRTQMLNDCIGRSSHILTCNRAKFVDYLIAYENVMEISLNRQDFASLPLQNLRYSALREALINMGTLMAFNNLISNQIVDKETFRNEDMLHSGLLLLALRILPQLAYYKAVDEWRLEEFRNPTENISESWWTFRKKYQGVEGLFGDECDYLEDEFVLRNKPYVSKFFGLLLQFQLLSYYQINVFGESQSFRNSLNADENFREMIASLATKSSLDLSDYYYNIGDVSEYHLLEFFQPLRDYMENAPHEQQPQLAESTTNLPVTTLQRVEEEKTTIMHSNLKINEMGNGNRVTKSSLMFSYIGIALAVCVLFVLIGIIVRNKRRKNANNKTSNNRRFNQV